MKHTDTLREARRAEAWRQRADRHGLRGMARRAAARLRTTKPIRRQSTRERLVAQLRDLLDEHSGSTRVHSAQCAEWFADQILAAE